MARIRLLADEELPPETAKQVAAIEGAGGDASVSRALAHHPELFERYFRFYSRSHDEGLLEPELKELVRLKVARLNDCPT